MTHFDPSENVFALAPTPNQPFGRSRAHRSTRALSSLRLSDILRGSVKNRLVPLRPFRNVEPDSG